MQQRQARARQHENPAAAQTQLVTYHRSSYRPNGTSSEINARDTSASAMLSGSGGPVHRSAASPRGHAEVWYLASDRLQPTTPADRPITTGKRITVAGEERQVLLITEAKEVLHFDPLVLRGPLDPEKKFGLEMTRPFSNGFGLNRFKRGRVACSSPWLGWACRDTVDRPLTEGVREAVSRRV